MPTVFPRTIRPNGASWPIMPSGLMSVGQSGKVQLRTTAQVGRTWTETYPLLKLGGTSPDPAARAFIAQVISYYRNQTILTVDHRSMRTLLGALSTALTVNGAGQTGSALNVACTNLTTTILKAGDVFTVAGSNVVYDVIADCTTDGSGHGVLSINPPIFAAPANGAVITTNRTVGAVTFRAIIESCNPPETGVVEWYAGFQVKFREMP